MFASDKQEHAFFTKTTKLSFSKPDTTTKEVAQYLIDLSNENKQGTIMRSTSLKNTILGQKTETTESDAKMQAQILLDLSRENNKETIMESKSFSQKISKTTESDPKILECCSNPIRSFAKIPFPIPASSTTLHITSKENLVTASASLSPFGDIPSDFKQEYPSTKHASSFEENDNTFSNIGNPMSCLSQETVFQKKTAVNIIRQNNIKSQKLGSNVLAKMSVDDIAMKLQTATVLQNSSTPVPHASPSLDSKMSVSTSPKNEENFAKKELMPDISSFLRKEMMKILPDMLQELYPAASGKIM